MTMNWYDDDRFWASMSPKMFNEAQWTKGAADVANVEKLLQLRPGMSVLDLCCGPGRHSLEFLRRGYTVTSVDRTPAYLEELRSRAKSEGLRTETVRDDMRNFVRPVSYDAAISLFTSFGYFDDGENRQVLRNIHSSLKEGGKLVVEMMGKEIIARIFQKHDWTEENGVLFLEERTPSDSWNRMKNRWIKIEGAERTEFEFDLRLYSAHELAEEARSAGFSAVRIYGGLEGTPYNENAERLVMTAVK